MSKKKSTPESTPKSTASAAAASAALPIERAYAAGNNAAVRALAKSAPQAVAEKFLALVRVDKGQLAVGIGAILVVLTAALLTLK